MVAGVTVGVIALPLALGFGVTSGMGAAAGLVTAIVAGLLAAVFGGSHVQVSGPTGAMTVVLVPIVARYGTDAVVVVGLLAGVLIVAASVLRLGRYLAYIPWPVVEGFTVGIAAIIFLQQVPAALGVPKPAGENTAAIAVRAVFDVVRHGSAATVGVTVLVALMVWLGPRAHRSFPASLAAVVGATVVVQLSRLSVARIGSLPGSLSTPSLPSFTATPIGSLLGAAFAVALLASLEACCPRAWPTAWSTARGMTPTASCSDRASPT
jgi:SulP family sulfate permease